MTITLCVIAGLVCRGLGLFLYEIKRAPLVDDTQPLDDKDVQGETLF